MPSDIKLIHGDCMEYMRQMPDKAFDLLVTSPPYNLGSFSRNGGKNVYDDYIGNNMDENDYRNWLKDIFSQGKRILKDSGNMAINLKYRYKDNTCIPPYWILDIVNMNLRNEIIWNYIGYTDVNKSKFFPGHEHIFVFSKTNTKIFFNEKFASYGDVWRLKQAIMSDKISGKIHPAPFPISLVRRLIEGLCPVGGEVIEPFLGSGTTAIACYDMGFNLTGYEIDKEYYDAAVKRLENHKKQLTMF